MENAEEKIVSSNHMLLEFTENEKNIRHKKNCIFCHQKGICRQYRTGCFQYKAAFCYVCFKKYNNLKILKSKERQILPNILKFIVKSHIDAKFFYTSDFDSM